MILQIVAQSDGLTTTGNTSPSALHDSSPMGRRLLFSDPDSGDSVG